MSRSRVALIGIASICTAACGAVLALEPLEFVDPTVQDGGADVADRDASVDALADGAVGPDADAAFTGADADAAPLGFCDALDGGFDGATIVLCDDFERAAPLEKGWIAATANGGTLTLSTEAASTGTTSLLVALPSGASAGVKSALLTTPAPPPGVKNVTLEMDIRVDLEPPATGNYPGNGYILGREYNVGAGFKAAFITNFAEGTFSPGFFPQDAPPSTPFVTMAWHHLVWSVVGTTQTLDVKPKSGGASIVRTASEPQDPAHWAVGAEIDANLGPVKMFFDNVVMYR
jgi:hypothetical protein